MIATTAFGRIGLADWSCETPNGNEINNFTGLTLYLKGRARIENLDKWYFYKGHVIGMTGRYSTETSYFFVANEFTGKIDSFPNEAEWLNYLSNNKLTPKMWTRWYRDDWTSYDGFALAFKILICSPLILVYFFLVYQAFRFENFRLKSPNTLIVTIVAGLIFIDWLLEQFPQSI
jgi:hypothetical protein